MTDPWATRAYLMGRDPVRALRCHAVDPLGEPPEPRAPCTCRQAEMVEDLRLGESQPRYMCVGRCRTPANPVGDTR